VNGGTGADTVTLSTAGNTVTVAAVTTVTTGSATANDTVYVADTAARTTTIGLGAGTDTVTITSTYGVTVDAADVESVFGSAGIDTISLSAATAYVDGGAGADVIHGGTYGATILGGAGNDTINDGTGADNINAGNDNDTINFATAARFAADTVNGGSGTDTVVLSGNDQTLSDANFANKSYIEVLNTGTGGEMDITIGTTAFAAGITTVTFGGTGDDTLSLTAAGSLIVNGGTGADTVTLSTAGNTVTVAAVSTVTTGSATANDTVYVANAAAGTVVVSLGAGTADAVIYSTTFATTLNASNVENITLGNAADVVTLTAGNAYINGGSGSDTVTLTTALQAVTVAGVETVNGKAQLADTVYLSGGTVTLTDVETIYGSTSADTFVDTITIAATGAGATEFNISAGSGADAITLTINGGATLVATTLSAYVYGGAGDDAITISNLNTTTATGNKLYNYLVGGAGADTITLNGTAASVEYTVDTVRIDLSTDVASGVVKTNADTIVGLASTDKIDLIGVTMKAANGDSVALTTGNAGSGDTITSASGRYLSTGVSNLSDLTSGSDANAVVINVTNNATTGVLTGQAGIDLAVTYITSNIGTVASGANNAQNVIFAINDGTNTALFSYTEAGTTGIQSTELTLVAVLNGVAGVTSGQVI
jgi:hypothetical protein